MAKLRKSPHSAASATRSTGNSRLEKRKLQRIEKKSKKIRKHNHLRVRAAVGTDTVATDVDALGTFVKNSDGESGRVDDDDDDDDRRRGSQAPSAAVGGKGLTKKDKSSGSKRPRSINPFAGTSDPYIDDEDREIARLEKLLGINSGKEKKKSAAKLSREYAKYEGIDGEFGEFLMDLDDLAASVVKGKTRPSKVASKAVDSDNEDEVPELQQHHIIDDDDQEASDIEYSGQSDSDNDNESSDGESGSGSPADIDPKLNIDSDVEDSSEGGTSKLPEEEAGVGIAHTYKPSAGEDIYGRIVDERAVISAAKYVPPAKRQQLTVIDQNSEDIKLLRRQMNGLMNRLSDQSKDLVVKGLIDIYRTNSTTVVNHLLKDFLIASCGNPTQIAVSIVQQSAAIVAALHVTIGVEVSAFILENFVLLMHQDILSYRAIDTGDPREVSSKRAVNYLLFVGYLYALRICHSQLITDVLSTLVRGCQEGNSVSKDHDAEMLVHLIDHCGIMLRGDDPSALRSLFATLLQRDRENEGTRFAVLLQYITDLKNNKSRRNQSVNDDSVKHLRKWLGAVKSASSNRSKDVCLRVSLQDLLDAGQRGRWWKAGASWVGGSSSGGTIDDDDDVNSKLKSESSVMVKSISAASADASKEQTKLLALAKKLRMSTTTRRDIFTLLMSSRDVNDAYERLSKLQLKGKQDREIIKVLVECCCQERVYNAFYSELAILFCSQNRQFRTTMQFTLWDCFKTIREDSNVSTHRCTNLGRLMAALICSFHIPLAVIKILDMAMLSASEEILLSSMFLEMFTKQIPEDTFQAVFDRVATTKEFAVVRDSVLIFLQRNMAVLPAGLTADQTKLVKGRRKVAISVMEAMEVLKYVSGDGDVDTAENEWAS